MKDSEILKDFLQTFSFSTLAEFRMLDIRDWAMQEKASSFAKELMKIKYKDIVDEVNPKDIGADDIIDFSFKFIGVHSTGTCGWEYTNAYLNFYLIPSDYDSFMGLIDKVFTKEEMIENSFFMGYIKKWYIDGIISLEEPDGYTHKDFVDGICDIIERTMRPWVHRMTLTYEMMDKQQWQTIYVGKNEGYVTFSSIPRENYIPFIQIVKGTHYSPFHDKQP